MAIDYRVSVAIPTGILELFGNDEEFIRIKNDAIENSFDDSISCGMLCADFSDQDDAILCEKKLDDLIDEFSNRQLAWIHHISQIQSSIGELVANTSKEMMQELLKQSGDGINRTLSKFLIEESEEWDTLSKTFDTDTN
jgi:hypothetical protein